MRNIWEISVGSVKVVAISLIIIASINSNALAQQISSHKADYRFDELEYNDVDGEVIDSLGGFNGRAKSSQPTSGKMCNALDLSAGGTGDYVILDEDVLNSETDFSVSLWIKTAKTGSQSLMSGATSGSVNDLIFWFTNSSRFRPYLKNTDNGAVDITDVGDNNWHHLVWTRSGSQSCLYRDKVLQGCVTQSTAPLTIQSLVLGQEQDSVGGNFDSAQAFNGLLDELMIFDEAISAAEITQIYDNQDAGRNYDGSARSCQLPDTLLEYRFEEETWNGTAGEILDNTGNGHNATVVSNSSPADALAAITGNPGTCGYASQTAGSIQVTGLPLDTTTDGVKTTVTFWMYWDGTNSVMPIGWNFHNIWMVSNLIGFNTWNNDLLGTSSAGLANSWHHITAEFTNGNASQNRLFIDGVEQTLAQYNQYPNNANAYVNSEMRVGGVVNSTAYNFHGFIDEVRVFESALSTSQIQSIMAETHRCGTPEPILEYRFDICTYDETNGDVTDESGNFNGNSNGIPPASNNAIINQSLDLTTSGTTDWVEVPNTVVDGLDDFSVAFWLKTSVSKAQQAIFQALGADAGDDELEIHLKNDNIVVVKVRNNSKELTSGIQLTDDNWHHISVTRIGSDICLFVDGAEQDCDNSSSAGVLSVSNSNSVIIGQEQDSFGGSFNSAQALEGELDEFKIFNVKLSDSEIDSIYQNELAGNNYDASTRAVIECETTCGTTAGSLNSVGVRINGSGSNTQINNTTEALDIHAAWLAAGSPATGLISGGTYNVSASGSSAADRIDFGGSEHDYSGSLPYPGASAGVGDTDFLVFTSGTFSLPAGTYTIYVESDDGFSFVMNRLSGDPVSFTKFGNSSAGASNELRFEQPTGNSNTGGSFTISQDSVFEVEAIFFERGGGDYLEVSIANDIRTSAAPTAGYEVLRHGALGGKASFGDCVTPSVIDHYQIIHDGQGLTCSAEQVTIQACTNAYDGSCTLSTDAVTVDLSATGSTTVTDSITFVGSGTASIPYTVAETVTFSLPNVSIAPNNATVCFDGTTTSCDMVFADAGFRFLDGNSGTNETISNQVAGTSFPIRVQAVRNNNGVCEGLFSGDKSIEMSQENVGPSGTGGLSFSIDGNDIAKYPGSTTTTLNFGADSIATIPAALYNDAGQIRLHADYSEGGIDLSGTSSSFWVSPAELVVTATSGATALNGANATASATHKAGENFEFTVTALNSLGVVTSNYSPGQIQFRLERTGPLLSGSVDGDLTYASGATMSSSTSPTFQDVTLSGFSSGVSTFSSAYYSEVGLLNLDIQDSNYGNVSIVVPSTAVNIGRFIPEHFKQTVVSDGFLHATCDSTIAYAAYSGQRDEATNTLGAISYLTNPVLAITAYNKQGNITRNYYQDSQGSANDYMKLSAGDVSITTPTADQVALGVDSTNLTLTANMNTGTLSQNDLTALPGVVALPRGVLHYQLSDADNFYYNRSANAIVAPFTSDIDFATASIVDSDNVNATTTANASPTGVEIRYGRLVVQNSFGPETSNFPQTMEIEHFDGTNFIATPTDNCTSYDAGKITLSNISLDPALTAVIGGTGKFVSGKNSAIELQATGTGNQGEVGVAYEAYDWLKYDWDNDGTYDDDPSAVATFGIYRGNDRIIHWREVFD
ncbi:MAG: MSHA biogenesis protein MshQ [Glaciecola sp.]|jgi:MSHA biogenesis protein MshQ